MSKPPTGSYLVIHYGFDGESHTPGVTLQPADAKEFITFEPRGHDFTLTFDTAQRFCAGWHELATSRSFACPDDAKLPPKYQQCRHCMNKTGFNPAFYNALSVSPQQQARNAEPHLLYLAHFGPGVVKVGISWARRGIRRLLDQGARSFVIIRTYPNADIARQYEARIAALSGIAEMIQPRKKQMLLEQPYDPMFGAQELQAARQRLIDELSVTPDDNPIEHLDIYYFGENQLRTEDLTDASAANTIAGRCLGMIGGRLLCQNGGRQYILPLSKLVGYRCNLRYEIAKPEPQPMRQASLF